MLESGHIKDFPGTSQLDGLYFNLPKETIQDIGARPREHGAEDEVVYPMVEENIDRVEYIERD